MPETGLVSVVWHVVHNVVDPVVVPNALGPASFTPMAIPTIPKPAVLEHCFPETVYSFTSGVLLAISFMLTLSWLVWMASSLPDASSGPTLPRTQTVPSPSTPLLRRNGQRLDALDGLRTVLVMYIVLYHVRWALPPLLAPWFQLGHWAVQFFFVLSGFVASCLHETSDMGSSDFNFSSARTYAVRRLTRLCPAYFVALLAIAAVDAHRGGGEPFLAWPIHALLLQSLMPVKVCGPLDADHWSKNFLPFALNGEGWFVSAILIASLCFPMLHNIRPRGGFGATVRTLLLVLCLRSVPTLLTITGHCPIDVYSFAPVRVLEFTAGMLFAQLYSQMPSWALACGAWDWIFDASLVCAMIPVWCLGNWHSWAATENNHGDFFLTGVFGLTCLAARGLTEHCMARGESYGLQWTWLMRPHDEKERGCECQCGIRSIGGAPLANLLASRALVAPAAYSYQAYIFQEVFIRVTAALAPADRFVWWLPVVLTWLAAVLSVQFFEDPLKHRVEARIRAAQLSAAEK